MTDYAIKCRWKSVQINAKSSREACWEAWGAGYQVLRLQHGEKLSSSISHRQLLQAERHGQEEHPHPRPGQAMLIPFHRRSFKPPSRVWLNGANLRAHARLLQGPFVPFWWWWSEALWHFPKHVRAACCKSDSCSSCVFHHSNNIYIAKF